MILQANQLLAGLSKVLEKAQENEGLLSQAQLQNPWFTPQSSKKALVAWAKSLEKSNAWLQQEYIANDIELSNRKVGIIMAGNLPLVGLHDLVCTVISGHRAIIKMSSQDSVLMKFIIENWKIENPELTDVIQISEDFIKDADAYIGTGSNNTARYFEYYFKNKAHIIRKNRNSVAILEKDMSEDDFVALGHDIFDYFGMGCRNVTRLFLPEGFDFAPMFQAWEPFHDMIHHHKYANNYTYHKAIFLMNLDKHLDNGFVILTERDAIHSPVSVLNYSFYQEKSEVLSFIQENSKEIQCVSTQSGAEFPFAVQFGQTQEPELWDYADGINTLQFLKKVK